MKRLMILLAVALLPACGGGSGSIPPLETPSASPWPLGVLAVVPGVPPSVPAGFQGVAVDVTCPGVTETIRAELAIRTHIGTPRGVVMLATGGGGTSWWTNSVPESFDFAADLNALGFTIVQVRWTKGWADSSPGNDAGPAHLGCRPATLIRHLYDTYYVPLGIQRIVGRAGFCITGNSGGAAQVSYALTHYGLDSILDVVIPCSGPAIAALAKSCLETPGEEDYWLSEGHRIGIDMAFGYFGGGGPAATLGATFKPRWLEESHSTGGNDYVHPTTRIHFILGEDDTIVVKSTTGDFTARLIAEGTPLMTVEVVPDTPHQIMASPEGRAALWAAILAE